MGISRRSNEELIFKSDGERAIVGVREALAKYHGGNITPELAPKSESSSNGRVEEAEKTVRGFVKVLKNQMEHKTRMTIESSDLIDHAMAGEMGSHAILQVQDLCRWQDSLPTSET